MRPLTTNLRDGAARPYFLWDEDISVDELRAVLAGPKGDVAAVLPRLQRRLGRRLPFWTFLIDGWRRDGLLAS